jgi:hypothetical protein
MMTRGGSDNIGFLIDTNILILGEDDRVIVEDLASLIRLLSDNHVPCLIHPLSQKELVRDRDDGRKGRMRSKPSTYSFLESPPDPSRDDSFRRTLGKHKLEYEVDEHMRYALVRDAVDFLSLKTKDPIGSQGDWGSRNEFARSKRH